MIEKKMQKSRKKTSFRKSNNGTVPDAANYKIYEKWMKETRKLALEIVAMQSAIMMINHEKADMNNDNYIKALQVINQYFSENPKEENLWLRNYELLSREIRKIFPLESTTLKTKHSDIYSSIKDMKIDNSVVANIISKLYETPIEHEKFSNISEYLPQQQTNTPVANGSEAKSREYESIFRVPESRSAQQNVVESRRQSMQAIPDEGSKTTSQPFSREFVPPQFGSAKTDIDQVTLPKKTISWPMFPDLPPVDLAKELQQTSIEFPHGINEGQISRLFRPYVGKQGTPLTHQAPIRYSLFANKTDRGAKPIWSLTHDKGATNLVSSIVDKWNALESGGKKHGEAQILPQEEDTQEDMF